MKIEFFLVNSIGERCTQMTAFNVPAHISKELHTFNLIQGICIIDNVPVKWAFSGYSSDGDIYTTNEAHRSIMHAMIPLFVYNLSYTDRLPYDKKLKPGWSDPRGCERADSAADIAVEFPKPPSEFCWNQEDMVYRKRTIEEMNESMAHLLKDDDLPF